MATFDNSAVSVELPDYVILRNKQAQAAGLRIEKQIQSDGRLTTWYRGTEAQWRASPFCQRDPARPFPRKSTMTTGFRCFGLSRGGFDIRVVSDSEFRGTLAKEKLPNWTEHLDGGITAYGMDGGAVVAYLGTKAELISRKIAPPLIETESWEYAKLKDRFYSGPMIWTCDDLDDGRCLYRDHVKTREEIAREEADRHKVNFESPSQMLAASVRIIRAIVSGQIDVMAAAETKSGKLFALTRDSLATINDSLDELIDAVRCAQVIERDADPAATGDPPAGHRRPRRSGVSCVPINDRRPKQQSELIQFAAHYPTGDSGSTLDPWARRPIGRAKRSAVKQRRGPRPRGPIWQLPPTDARLGRRVWDAYTQNTAQARGVAPDAIEDALRAAMAGYSADDVIDPFKIALAKALKHAAGRNYAKAGSILRPLLLNGAIALRFIPIGIKHGRTQSDIASHPRSRGTRRKKYEKLRSAIRRAGEKIEVDLLGGRLSDGDYREWWDEVLKQSGDGLRVIERGSYTALDWADTEAGKKGSLTFDEFRSFARKCWNDLGK